MFTISITAIIAIVVGVVALFLLIFAGMFFYHKRTSRSARRRNASNSQMELVRRSWSRGGEGEGALGMDCHGRQWGASAAQG